MKWFCVSSDKIAPLRFASLLLHFYSTADGTNVTRAQNTLFPSLSMVMVTVVTASLQLPWRPSSSSSLVVIQREAAASLLQFSVCIVGVSALWCWHRPSRSVWCFLSPLIEALFYMLRPEKLFDSWFGHWRTSGSTEATLHNLAQPSSSPIQTQLLLSCAKERE